MVLSIQRVCRLSTCISKKPHVQIFCTCHLWLWLCLSWQCNTICTSGMWMTSRYHTMEQMGQNQRTHVIQFTRWRHQLDARQRLVKFTTWRHWGWSLPSLTASFLYWSCAICADVLETNDNDDDKSCKKDESYTPCFGSGKHTGVHLIWMNSCQEHAILLFSCYLNTQSLIQTKSTKLRRTVFCRTTSAHQPQ